MSTADTATTKIITRITAAPACQRWRNHAKRLSRLTMRECEPAHILLFFCRERVLKQFRSLTYLNSNQPFMGMQMHRCHHNHRPMSSSRCGRPNRLPTSQKVILTVRHSLPIYPNEQTFSESGESSASSRLLALKKALPRSHRLSTGRSRRTRLRSPLRWPRAGHGVAIQDGPQQPFKSM
jgi:hypothetical protein